MIREAASWAEASVCGQSGAGDEGDGGSGDVSCVGDNVGVGGSAGEVRPSPRLLRRYPRYPCQHVSRYGISCPHD